MKTQPTKESNAKETKRNSGFTLRAVIIAILITIFLTASSSYIAIKLGALPWPIIFSVIVAGGLLKLINWRGKENPHEINVAQAGGSIGGLVAAGVVFTIPGIIFLNQSKGLAIPLPNPWILALLTVLAGVLGVLVSIPLKKAFVDKENLPYASGIAGAELLKLGTKGGRLFFGVVLVGALTGIFALFRDLYFPAGWTWAALIPLGIFLTFYPMPLAVSAGYILGVRPGVSWFFGAILGWLILIPMLAAKGMTSGNAIALAQNLGMGIVLGSGIGFFIIYLIPRMKKLFAPFLKGSSWYALMLLSVASVIALRVGGVPLIAALLTVLGTWIMVIVAARMTGETNIDPLEQFGIFVGLIIALIYGLLAINLDPFASFLIVAFVSVACAVAGDIGHDYKSAQILGTRISDIVRVDLIAVVVAGLIAPFVLHIIFQGFQAQLFTPTMPAPQAQLVAGSIFGFAYPLAFMIGFGLAFLVELINMLLPKNRRNKVLMMPLGIGLFLGFAIAIPLGIGALLRWIVDKKYSSLSHTVLLIAAGVMGGEGIAGFTAGTLTVAGVVFTTGAFVLIGILAIIAVMSFIWYMKKEDTHDTWH